MFLFLAQMLAKELRLGNIVNCGDQLLIVTGILPSQIHGKNIDSDYQCVYEPEMLKGCHLDGQLLTSFGFRKWSGQLVFSNHLLSLDIPNGGTHWIVKKINKFGYDYLTLIQYAHELQNLYLDLSKIELQLDVEAKALIV
jgi:hypothetical protein